MQQTLTHPSHHKPDIEVVKFCTHAYIADIKGIYNELERYQERYEMLSEPLQGVSYERLLVGSTSCKGERQTQLLEVLESLRESIASIEGEYLHFTALLATLEFGAYISDHYLLGLSWSLIALREHVTRMTIQRRVDKTLRELYAIMPEQYRRYSIPSAL